MRSTPSSKKVQLNTMQQFGGVLATVVTGLCKSNGSLAGAAAVTN